MLPPEITSALIHSGPGAGSLIEASSVWQQLSIELEASLGSYVSEVSSLTAAWRGPSSLDMAAAVEPYFDWLRMTAQQCERVAASVRAVVAAFELTHFTVVPPAVVAANRTRLAFLLATNFFGINMPAIAETEAEYVTMWINNSTSMYRYAATSAGVLVPQQFSPPPTIVNPAGTAAQAAAVPAPTTLSSAQSVIDQIGSLLTSIVSTPGGFNPNKGWFGLANTWANQTIAAGGWPVGLLGVLAQLQTASGFQSLGGEVGTGLAEGEAGLAAAEVQFANALGASGWAAAPTAQVGAGVLVGKLVAPPGVVGLFPSAEQVQLASAASALPAKTPLGLGIPMTPMVPGAAGKRRREGRDYDNIEYGSELLGTVMQRPPSAG